MVAITVIFAGNPANTAVFAGFATTPAVFAGYANNPVEGTECHVLRRTKVAPWQASGLILVVLTCRAWVTDQAADS